MLFLYFGESECLMYASPIEKLALTSRKKVATRELIRSGVMPLMGNRVLLLPELTESAEKRRVYKNADNREDKCVYSGLTVVKMRAGDIILISQEIAGSARRLDAKYQLSNIKMLASLFYNGIPSTEKDDKYLYDDLFTSKSNSPEDVSILQC